MSTPSQFQILWPYTRQEVDALESLGCPRSVPWSLVAPHEAQAQRNHGQTLERLHERGGLAPCELCAVLEDRRWRRMADGDAVDVILEAIAKTQANPAA